MVSTNEETQLVEQLHYTLGDLDASFSDDLEGLLTWLNPNETQSNHQLRPPILRIKSAIKTLVNNKNAQEPFLDLLRQFVVYQTRVHFFSNFRSLVHFKDLQKLERYYEFPLRFLELFGDGEWTEEISGFRNYLIFYHPVLARNVKLRLKQLILEDDFEMAMKVYSWLCSAEGHSLTQLLVDIILAKVKVFASKEFSAEFTRRFVIMETYNSFMASFWSTLSTMLECPEDNHEITKEIYESFEAQFIEIRTRQAFDIFVTEYPNSKPTLLELRAVLKSPSKYTQLITELLVQFEARVLKPSVTTVEILLSYVKAIKSILTVDISNRYFQLLTNFVRPYLMERRDAVVSFLNAMLGMGTIEHRESGTKVSQANITSQLSKEISDSYQPIFTTTMESSSHSQQQYTPIRATGEPVCSQVIARFLEWSPEPSDSIQFNGDNSFMSEGIFNIIIELFDSRDVIIAEFLRLFKEKLFNLRGYRLETNWHSSLKILKERVGLNKFSNAQDFSNVNNIDVMLRDIKQSEDLCCEMHKIPNINVDIVPKIISYLFWGIVSDSESSSREVVLPTKLDHDMTIYKNNYAKMKKGRKLRLHPAQSLVKIRLTCANGRTSRHEVSMDKAVILSCFSSEHESKSLTLEEVSAKVDVEKEFVQQVLNFWLQASVLTYDHESGLYCTLDHGENSDDVKSSRMLGSTGSTIHGRNDSGAAAVRSQQQELFQSMERVWPFIKGMLTNLGSMKPEKIHSFLKMAVPKEMGFTATVSQLESFLCHMVDENQLESTASGAFKLVK
ncbi:LADA_0F02124g1_1 [Lachancea dasiensis]|uniref:Anaphase-promoting complex subunit 2 n=1 Tax=Lachancea dasiensis TaxID=1072105 RepID=A0A1G4JIF8_9SACH|nr:LADA_0F02124g1_1 [Lachancea dasiensis]